MFWLLQGKIKMDKSITDKQIERQVEGRTRVEVHYTDVKPDYLSLYNQVDGYYIKPAFCKAKKISETMYNDLVSQFGVKEHTADRDILISNMTYNDFFDKYYNSIKDPYRNLPGC